MVRYGVSAFSLTWLGLFLLPSIVFSVFILFFVQVSACLLERSHEARSFVQIKQARRSIGWGMEPKRKGKSNV
jgi:hypothetical protein